MSYYYISLCFLFILEIAQMCDREQELAKGWEIVHTTNPVAEAARKLDTDAVLG